MREDWNRRAKEDAHYYVAFGRHEQDEDEFLATAADVLRGFDRELKRGLPGNKPSARRALEIGCGPGRLLKPMSQRFGEVHGVDVSDEMIAIARQRLKSIPHAHAHAGSGADLKQFADESFDFIYSYAVFQHIPEKAVVLSYLAEAARVLKPGGLMRFQVSNLAAERNTETTWHGCNVSPEDIRAYAAQFHLRLLAVEGVATQYMWITIRKPGLEAAAKQASVKIRRVTNSESSEPLAPVRGRYAALSAWVEGLPATADLLSLDLRIAGQSTRLTYLGMPESDGIQQLNAVLPAGLATGFVPLDLLHNGQLVAASTFRIIPEPPAVPRLIETTDGHDYMSGTNIVSGTVKLFVEELFAPESLRAKIGDWDAFDYSILCTDPMSPRHEINFRLPDAVPAGPHTLHIEAGRRLLGTVAIEVKR